MMKEYDVRGARPARSRHLPSADQIDRHTSVSITITLDRDVLEFFRQRATTQRVAGPYQTQINRVLREYVDRASGRQGLPPATTD